MTDLIHPIAARTDASVVGTVATRARSPEEAITRANLPDGLARLVRETVRRTRLRRHERTDIACELISHLREGLEQGTDPRRLEADFGDPKVVSKLLRTAARRRRPPLDRLLNATLRTGASAVAAILLIYVGSAIVLAMKKPHITFTPAERLNALAPTAPVEDRAWPLYREAMAWNRAAAAMADRSRAPNDRVGAAILDPQADAATVAAEIALLRAHEREIALLRRAASMPVLGRAVSATLDAEDRAFFDDGQDWDDPSWELLVPFPHLTELRWAGRLLHADARVAASDGDFARAVDSIVAMLGVARHTGEQPIIITQLVETALVVSAAEETARLVADSSDRLPEELLFKLRDAFASIPASTWRIDLAGERLFFENIIQHTFSDDGRGGGVLLASAARRTGALLGVFGEEDERHDPIAFAVGPLAAIVSAGRRETLETADRFYSLVEPDQALPIAARAHLLDVEVERMAGSPWMRLRHPLITMLMPAISKSADVRAAARNNADAARIAVALELYRRAHGTWPASLDELVPAFLPEVPVDAYDDQPVRYRLSEDGPLVWSVGPNGIDDDGTYATDVHGVTRSRPRSRRESGDFILLDWRE